MIPIAARKRREYPADWPELSRTIRFRRAGGLCEFCRMARHGEVHPLTGSLVILTVAHLDHDHRRGDPNDLAAMCQRCHNIYDGPLRRRNAARTRRAKRAARDLFEASL